MTLSYSLSKICKCNFSTGISSALVHVELNFLMISHQLCQNIKTHFHPLPNSGHLAKGFFQCVAAAKQWALKVGRICAETHSLLECKKSTAIMIFSVRRVVRGFFCHVHDCL